MASVLEPASLVASFDAVVLATGSTVARDLDVEGRNLGGVVLRDGLPAPSNLAREGRLERPTVDAAGHAVVILGGGDTGADCLGTAHRQGARSVLQVEILDAPPTTRAADNPWPTWPVVLRTTSAHEEGGDRRFAMRTARLVGHAGRVVGIEVVDVHADGTGDRAPRTLPADLVILAMGFTGPEDAVLTSLGVERTERTTVAVSSAWRTSVDKVFACGDAVRGQSLVVWAIAEGRSCAVAVDRALMGTSGLPGPVVPYQLALR